MAEVYSFIITCLHFTEREPESQREEVSLFHVHNRAFGSIDINNVLTVRIFLSETSCRGHFTGGDTDTEAQSDGNGLSQGKLNKKYRAWMRNSRTQILKAKFFSVRLPPRSEALSSLEVCEMR